MRALWLTDLHLNFVSSTSRRKFYDHVRATGGEVALVGGDIGEATSVGGYLSELEVALAILVYFVLGSHDFYHGSFKSVRGEVAALSKRSQRLTWLTTAGVVPLTESTALIGHDSWGDGRLGEGEASEVMLNDSLLIEDLLLASKRELFKRLYALGDEAARETDRNLCEALGGLPISSFSLTSHRFARHAGTRGRFRAMISCRISLARRWATCWHATWPGTPIAG